MSLTNNSALDLAFDSAVSQGYRQGKKDFVNLISSDYDAFSLAFNQASENGYQDNQDEFANLVGLQSIPVKKKGDTEFPLEDTSLEYQPDIKKEPIPDLSETVTDWFNTLTKEPKLTGEDSTIIPKGENSTIIPKGESLDKYDSNNRFQKELLIKKELDEENRKELLNDPNYLATLESINPDIFNNKATASTQVLRGLISDYGFNVDVETYGGILGIGASEGLKVTSTDGNGELLIKTGEEFNPQSIIDLKKLISDNAKAKKPINPNQSVYEKAIKVKEMRDVPRINEDGSASTVKLTSFEEDGKFYVAPTLFPKANRRNSTRRDAWVELSNLKDIIAVAKDRDEIMQFNTKEEAERFAEGSWKTINTVDLEKEKFFENRGVLNYHTKKEMADNYRELRDELFFIEGDKFGFWSTVKQEADEYNKGTEEQIKKYPNLYNDKGFLRGDINTYKEELRKKVNTLYDDVIEDDEYDDIETDWDFESEKRRTNYINQSIGANKQIDMALDKINEFTLKTFDVPFDDIDSYTPKTELEFQSINYLKNLNAQALAVRDTAAKNFLISKSYMDSKIGKNASGELLDGIMNNVMNEYNTRYPKGKAAEVIIELGMYSDGSTTNIGFDKRIIGNKNDRQLASELISKYMTQSVLANKGTSRGMFEVQKAKGYRETKEAALDNFWEVSLSTAAGSLSEMLPYGSKLIPNFMIKGGLIGAAIGYAQGAVVGATAAAATVVGMPLVPKAALATANANAIRKGILGLVRGAQVGMGATILGMEYTNALIEAMEERGYDLFNPKDVEIALSDANVWKDGQSKGLARGIPIALIDVLSAGMAGKIFSSTRGLARLGLMTGERLLLDPGAEALGEATAQITNNILNGEELNGSEVMLEAMGGIGANFSNMTVNLALQAWKSSSVENIKEYGKYGLNWRNPEEKNPIDASIASPGLMTNMINNLSELKWITPEQAQKAQIRVGSDNAALEILNIANKNKNDIDNPSVTRLSQLIGLKNILESSKETQDAFKPIIRDVKDEIQLISTNGKWSPEYTKVGPEIFQNIMNQINEKNFPQKTQETVDELIDSSFDESFKEYKQSDLGGGMEADSFEKNNLVEETKKLSAKERKKLQEDWIKNNPNAEIDDNGDVVAYRVGSIREGATPMTTDKNIAETIARERAKQGLSSNVIKTKIKLKDVAVFVPGSEAEVIVDVNQKNLANINQSSEVLSKGKSLEELTLELEENEKALKKSEKALIDKNESASFLKTIEANIPKLKKKIKNLKAQVNSKKKTAKPKSKGATKTSLKKDYDNSIENIEEELNGKIEETKEEIASIKIDLKKDLLKTGLSTEEKTDLKEDAKSEIDSLKEDLTEAKKEARQAKKEALKLYKESLKKLKGAAQVKNQVPEEDEVTELEMDANVELNISSKENDVSLSQKNISELFTDDQTSNTNVVAFSKVPLSAIKDKRIPGGTTRDVYDIGNDRVIKIAKNPRGLQQNASIGYGDANMLGGKVPEIYEVGTDYIVVENVPRNDKSVREYLKPLQKFTQKDFDDRGGEIQEVMEEMGLSDFFNYDVLWNDFTSRRNWGQRKNGEFVLVDEGTLNKNVTATSAIPDWARQEWSEVKRDRKGGSDVSLSQRRIPLKNLLLDYGYDTETGFFPNTISNISPLKKGLQTFGYDLITNNDEVTGKVTGYHIAQEGGKRKLDLFKGEKLKREARQGKEVSPETRKEVVELLSKAFPGIKVFDDVEAFEEAIKRPGVVKRKTKNGYIAYGAAGNGSIYLNPSDKTLEVPIHEFGHAWVNYLKNNLSGKKGTSLYNRGLQLLTSTKEGQDILDQQQAIYGVNSKATEEALVELIAIEGARRVGQAKSAPSVKSKMRTWFDALVEFIKRNFTKLKDLFASTSFDQTLRGMTQQEFLDLTIGEMLGGTAINPDYKMDENGQFLMFTQRRLGVVADIKSFIRQARERGYKDSTIRTVLKKRLEENQELNYKLEEIDNALSYSLSDNTSLPLAFTDLEGGFNVGVKLYKRILKKIENFVGKKGTLEDVRARHILQMRKQNPNDRALSTTALLRKYPVELTTKEVLKKKSEVRAFAKSTLENSQIFKEQNKLVQRELIVALDNELNIRSGKEITKEISDLKKLITERKNAIKDINKVKEQLRRYIRLNYPKVNDITTSEVNKLIAIVNEVKSPNEYMAAVESILNRIYLQNEKTKNKLLQKLKKQILDVGGKPALTIKSQLKSRGVDAETGAFFQEAGILLGAIISDDVDTIERLRYELQERELEIAQALLADRRGEVLTVEQQKLLNKTIAWEVFADIKQLSLEEVEAIYQDFVLGRKIGRELFSKDRLERVKELEALSKEASREVKKLAPELYNEDGVLKNDDRIQQDLLRIMTSISKGNVGKSLKILQKEILKPLVLSTAEQIAALGRNYMGITRTVTNRLDAGETDFFTKQVYRLLALGEENAHKGRFRFYDKLEAIASKFISQEVLDKESSTIGMPFKKEFQIKLGRPLSPLNYIRKKLILMDLETFVGINPQRGASKEANKLLKEIEKSVGVELEKSNKETKLSGDVMAAVFLQWQNADSRKLLEKDGFTQKMINRIEKILGKDIVGFLNEVMEELTYVEYELLNEVYKKHNQVNLLQEFPYFPRKTERIIKRGESEKNTVDDIGFVRNFENIAPGSQSLRSIDSKNLRNLLGFGFFNLLDSYIEESERYKAYSDIVPRMDAIMNTPAVRAYLKTINLYETLSRMINTAIHPRGYLNAEAGIDNIASLIMSKMTSVALALKPVQLVKQSLSSINAFAFYNNTKALEIDLLGMKKTPFKFGKIKFKGKLEAGQKLIDMDNVSESVFNLLKSLAVYLPNESLEFTQFMQEYGVLMKNRKDSIERASAISATFRSRREEGLKGKMFALVTGQEEIEYTPEVKKLLQSFTLAEEAFGYFTTEGDINGVLGYLVAYDKMIENGVSTEDALSYFNDYNLTQQTRRGLGKNRMQIANFKLFRILSMFKSSLYLMLNAIARHSANITRALKKGITPKKEDTRGLIINSIAIQALFTAIGSFPLLFGNDREREKFAMRIMKSPMAVFYVIPLVGSSLQTFFNAVNDKEYLDKYVSDITNPLKQISTEIGRDISDGDYLEIPSNILQFIAGVDVRMPRAGARILLGQGDFWYNFFSLLGYADGSIPKGWQPKPSERDDLFIDD